MSNPSTLQDDFDRHVADTDEYDWADAKPVKSGRSRGSQRVSTALSAAEDSVILDAGKPKAALITEAFEAFGWKFKYDERLERIVKSLDGGETWVDIRGNDDRIMWFNVNSRVRVRHVNPKGEETLKEFEPSRESVRSVRDTLAEDNPFDPFLDYLNALPETKVSKEEMNEYKAPCDTFLTEMFTGMDNTRYTRALTRNIVLGAVARTFEPGSKSDIMTILHGRQGCGKDAVFRALVPKEDTMVSASLSFSMDEKKIAEKTRGLVFAHMSDMSGVRKAEMEGMKALLTNAIDKERFAYRSDSDVMPRRFVFVGSTNLDKPLPVDPSGHRRFGVLRLNTKEGEGCPAGPVEPWLEARRPTIWASAIALWKAGARPGFGTDAELREEQTRQNIGEQFVDSTPDDAYTDALQAGKLSANMQFTKIAEALGFATENEMNTDFRIQARIHTILAREGWTQKVVRIPVERRGITESLPRRCWIAPEGLDLSGGEVEEEPNPFT